MGEDIWGNAVLLAEMEICTVEELSNTMFSEHLQWHFPSISLFHMKSVEFRLSGFKGSLCELLSEKGNGEAPINHS